MYFNNCHSDIHDFQQKEEYCDIALNGNLLSRNSLAFIHCYPPQTPPLYWNDAGTIPATTANITPTAIPDISASASVSATSPIGSYNDESLSCCSSLSSTPKTNMLNHQQFEMTPDSYTHQMVDPMLFIPPGMESETTHKDSSHCCFRTSNEQLCEPISIEGNAQTLYFHEQMAYNTPFFYYDNTNSAYSFQPKPTLLPLASYYNEQNNMNATSSHQNTYRYRSFPHASPPLVKQEVTETKPLINTDTYENNYTNTTSDKSTTTTTPSSSSSLSPSIPSSQIIPINDTGDTLPGYPCKYPNCNKRFSRPYNLKSHMRTHTSDRPFACNYPGCGWKFARPHDLKRHQLQHTGQKPHSCKFCHRRFARSDALKRHWKVDAACAQALKQDQIASEATLSKEISNLCKKKKSLLK